MVTDPPYGMAFQSGRRKTAHRKIANDGNADALAWACALPASHSKYVWMRWDNLAQVPAPNSLITWVKNNHSMGDLKHEHGRQTEVCAFYPGPDHFFPGGRPTDVVKAGRSGNEFHPTQKPVGLMMQVVEWTSGVVVDPFMGSGSTLVACSRMGRHAIGIEIDPEYFEIACQRVSDAQKEPDLFGGVSSDSVQEVML